MVLTLTGGGFRGGFPWSMSLTHLAVNSLSGSPSVLSSTWGEDLGEGITLILTLTGGGFRGGYYTDTNLDWGRF